MISARRAALLGLTVPLSAIMLAVLGLWPEPEDDDVFPAFPPPADPRGGGSRRKKAEPRKPKAEDDDYLTWRRRLRQQTQAVIAAACAIGEEMYA